MMKLLALALLFAASAAQAEIYTWRAGGTDYYTNSFDEIPARYLNKARVLDVATGKKGALATARPVAPPGGATAAGNPTAPGSPSVPAGAALSQGAAPASVPSTAAAAPATAPEPVAVTTSPAAVPPQATAPQYRSREKRIERRSRRRAYHPEEE